MKYTLLDLTQTVLSSMDSDEINSISDSVESQQVAKIIRTVYYDIINRSGLPELNTPVNLSASGDSTKPVIMYVPEAVSKVDWVQYDNATLTEPNRNLQPVYFIPFKEFMERSNGLDIDETTVDSFSLTVNGATFNIQYKNDKAPEYYTTFDDSTFIFDSFDSAVDTTLQSSKTLAYGRRIPVFTMSDTFTPELDEPQFQLLLNEAKALAWAELKQAAHTKAEQNSRRGWVSLQRSKVDITRMSDFEMLPSFGRK